MTFLSPDEVLTVLVSSVKASLGNNRGLLAIDDVIPNASSKQSAFRLI
jgi:hypothetical protein